MHCMDCGAHFAPSEAGELSEEEALAKMYEDGFTDSDIDEAGLSSFPTCPECNSTRLDDEGGDLDA